MVKQEFLLSKIEEWVGEGLISPEQADALKRRETESATVSVPARRVKTDEIFVYLGSLVIFLALAFLVGLNWRTLGSAGRILSVLLPTVVMLALGWRLRGSERARLRRGAQALWLGGCLLSGLVSSVTFYEVELITEVPLLILVSCLLATGVAGVAFVLVPSIAQSVAFHLCGSAAFFAFLIWLEETFPPLNPWRNLMIGLLTGGLFLALSEWLRARERKRLAAVSRIFGTLIVLGSPFFPALEEYAVTWHKTAMEVIAFLTSIAFIAASVKRQSQTFLYGGAAFLLFLVTYVNFEHFADTIGMPITLLIIGAALIGLGLGTGRLSKHIQAPR